MKKREGGGTGGGAEVMRIKGIFPLVSFLSAAGEGVEKEGEKKLQD